MFVCHSFRCGSGYSVASCRQLILVEDLGQAIREKVVEALMRRGVPGNVANRTEILELTLDWPEDRIDRARRAVSIGTGSGSLAELKYREALAPSVPGTR